MKDAAKILDDFAYGIIKQREEQGLGNFTGDKKVAESTDLLSLYMALRDENGQAMSKQALRFVPASVVCHATLTMFLQRLRSEPHHRWSRHDCPGEPYAFAATRHGLRPNALAGSLLDVLPPDLATRSRQASSCGSRSSRYRGLRQLQDDERDTRCLQRGSFP